jgi:hypothetical protein
MGSWLSDDNNTRVITMLILTMSIFTNHTMVNIDHEKLNNHLYNVGKTIP